MTYDALGRMVTRADYKGPSLQNFSRWYYDRDPGCDSQYRFDGKLVAVAQAQVPISSGCNANVDDFDYLQLLQYDRYGRLGETSTILGVLDGDGDFFEKVTFDQYSRAHRAFDASNQQVGLGQNYLYGVETAYNPYGYKTGVRDVQAAAGQGFYYTVQRMNLRGQVEEVALGNGLTTTYVYDPQSHRLIDVLTDIVPGVGTVQQLHYDWDTIGNLLSKTDQSGDGSYQKDLQESYQYDGLNRLRYAYLYNGGSQTAVQEVRYDDGGNITHKSDVGDYFYNGSQPHAVTFAGGVRYIYDDSGNLIHDSSGRELEYTVFDKPDLIQKGSHNTHFFYGPDRSRYKRVDDSGSGTVITLQLGGVEKVIERDSNGAFVKGYYRRTLAGVAVERLDLAADDSVTGTGIQYLHKDLQGSLDVITDSNGQVAQDAGGNKQVFSFDAWGKRRNALSWAQISGGPQGIVSALSVGSFNHLTTNRGFTGHEMLDEVGLIHMNGRVYDPNLARFVSADPVVDGVTSVQGYNRYAYVHNNPLMYTDPSGYSSWSKYRDSVVKPVVALVITIYSAGTASGAAWGYFGGAVTTTQATGAVIIGGAAAGAVQTGTVEGAFFGAFSAVLFWGSLISPDSPDCYHRQLGVCNDYEKDLFNRVSFRGRKAGP
ncbi:RHS repeat-associated core domain-containing protein [Microbulbifer sp. 2201CG32-9]|uniref:RHS repeat-associated core domain-containing protein n=1 Tax=Microbulbifer sp. 2201CG32-9 TaxID=3232309 RepID=UPI00345C4F40